MKVTINLPNRPKDDPVEIPGLGLFENGSSTEVEDGDVETAVAAGLLPESVLDEDELVFGAPGEELPPPQEEDTPVEESPAPAPVDDEGGEE